MSKTTPLPAYDEGRVESLHEGVIESEATKEPGPVSRSVGKQDPKHADQPDAFISSEAAKEADPHTTS
jgi:hypothetical protein